MFRFFRPASRLLPSSRIAAQAHGSQPVVLHRVRLGKPNGKLRNVLFSGAVVFTCYAIYTSVVISPLVKSLDDHEEKSTPEDGKEMAEIEPLFIALPFTTKAIRPPPYSGSGPEWQEFIKISRDKKQQEKIKDLISDSVARACNNSITLTAKTGKDLKVRRYWIDIDFPYGPPMEYERSGLLVTDDTIEWASRPVHSSTVFRTSRILWPSPMLLSTWAFAGTLLKQNIFDVAKVFGYEPKNPTIVPASPNQQRSATMSDGPPALPPSNRPDIQQAIQRIKQQATTRPEEVKDPRAVASSQNRQTPDGGPPPGSSSGAGSYPDGKDGDSGKPNPLEGMFPGHDKIRELTSGPWKEFRRKLATTWKARHELPPRGCVCVTGLVELDGSKAMVVIDVYAWYNPKTRNFDGRHVALGIRRVQMKKQRPLRP